MAHALQRIVVGDEPDSWRAAGFRVDGSEARFGKVVIELVGAEGDRGVLGWSLAGVAGDVEQIPTVVSSPERSRTTDVPAEPGAAGHTNSVFAVDHVVVETGDVDRTVQAFADVGMGERRRSTMTTPMGERQQSFLWAGRVIVEVVGPVEPDSEAAMGIWGLAFVSSNLQTTAHVLAENLSEPRDAVQPGRKIATMRTCALDISVPIVVMSPHVAELL